MIETKDFSRLTWEPNLRAGEIKLWQTIVANEDPFRTEPAVG